jgi:3'(2'), 5'-bisphosphate nucleotidase
MPVSTKLPKLALIAQEAGDIVLAMRPHILRDKDWEIKSDGSPVTPADIAAHQYIKRRLAEEFPGVALVSEEGTKEEQAAALKARDRFDSDPLDNTGGYIGNRDGFSVNIGRITDGVPVEGAVYFPARRELYYTQDGNAYLKKGDGAPEKISVKGLPVRKPLQVAVGFNEQHVDYLGERGLKKDEDYQIQEHPGQYRTCQVAAGKCDVSGLNNGQRGGFDSWDTAGPHAVLRAAGGDFVMLDGQPLRYGETTKLPAHIAGGVDTLKALGLADQQQFKSARVVGG